MGKAQELEFDSQLDIYYTAIMPRHKTISLLECVQIEWCQAELNDYSDFNSNDESSWH